MGRAALLPVEGSVMWSMLMEHILANAPMLGIGIVLTGVLWILVALILGVIALRKAKPENIADIIVAFSRWWRSK
jgi:hypothetical protein